MGVLLPYGKEKVLFVATAVSAVLNIIANFALVSMYKQNAAAFTTALSQFVVFLICFICSKEHINMRLSYKSIYSTILGCVGIIMTCRLIERIGYDSIAETIFCIVASCVVYFIVCLFTKNSALSETLESLQKIIKDRIHVA